MFQVLTNSKLSRLAALALAGALVISLSSCDRVGTRFSKFNERIRSIGKRDAVPAQQVPPPVGALPSQTPAFPTANVGSGGAMVTVSEADINWTPEGARDYHGQYKSDPQNKAFAISPSGPYGVAFGYPTAEQAEAAALAECRLDVSPGQLDCLVFDRNGTIVLQLPARVSRR
jgi:hypothetical protein